MTSAQYIGTGEVAALLRIHRSTVQRHAEAGTLPYVQKLPGRRGYLFDAAVIASYVPSSAMPTPDGLPPADEGVSSLPRTG